ncbi:MAG: hypothetical protein ACPG32_11170 [Akkermansiaceae bacterium]
MHMRFTDEELLTLAEMMTLACWATFWNHKPGSDEGVARYDDMLEKILTRLQHGGLGEHVEMDPERQKLRMRKDREDGSFYAQCYDEMRNETFWEELVARMAERELNRKHGEAHMKSLSEEKRKELSEPVTKRFWQEFSTRGIGNLHVVARNGEG